MRVKKVVEGVKAVTDGFLLDFTVGTPDDIIDIASTHIEKSNIGPNIYYFGYKFNDNVPSSIRNKFISWLKMLKPGKNSISSSDLYRFIEKPLAELDSACPLITFDAIVYPKSGRSPLVSDILKVVFNYMNNDAIKIPNNELNIAHIMNSNKILIVDDISTSGATLFEMLRIIRTINHNAEIYVFTLVGKSLEFNKYIN